MFRKLRLGLPRPSSATVIAFVALVFAMAGGAVAKDKIDKDEVTVVTTTGGPVQSVNPSEEPPEAEIPLSNPTFTQKAGEAALVSAEADISGVPQETANCDLFVVVSDRAGSLIGLFMEQLARRGDPGTLGGSRAVAAPATDREITLSAFAQEAIPPDDQGNPVPDEGQCDAETFTVSVRVSITTLRN